MSAFPPAKSIPRIRNRRFGLSPRMRFVYPAVLCALGAIVAFLSAAAPVVQAQSSAEVLRELERLRNTTRVLYVAAHPDDENTHLLAYLAHGLALDVAYLSMTRGEGGQNLIGSQLGDALGAIRTHELLEARRIDGARQFFSHAADFGYSKRYEETLGTWGHDDALADVVFAVRWFRPDVIITRFPPEPMDGMHGHHTASARLAIEALDAAADSTAFPEQLAHVSTWRATRVVFNDFRGIWDAGEGLPAVEMETGGFDAVSGSFYGEIAARSRSMHKSQGFGAVAARGHRIEHFIHLAGEPAQESLFDGIDNSWVRYDAGGDVERLFDNVITEFDVTDASASVEALLGLAERLDRIPSNTVIQDKRRRLDQLIAAAAGVYTETLIDSDEAVPGEELALRHRVIIGSDIDARWKSVRYPSLDREQHIGNHLRANEMSQSNAGIVIPAAYPISRPFWLHDDGGFDPRRIVGPHAPPALPVEYVIEIGGREVVVTGQPEVVRRDPVDGEVRTALAVVPPGYVSFVDELMVFEPGESRDVEVEVLAVRGGVRGVVRLDVPSGWATSPASHPFRIETGGGTNRVVFQLTAPTDADQAEVSAEVLVDGRTYDRRAYSARREVISFDHLDPIVLNPPARLIATSVDARSTARHVGYIEGAGDDVPAALRAMEIELTTLDPLPSSSAALDGFDAVVTGIRAFNTRNDLAESMPVLFDYVARGGVLIIQYNTTNDLLTGDLPVAFNLSRGRVTNEASPVQLVAPDHPMLTTPNRITSADFDDWVQERGLYFAGDWDERFVPILAMSDPGEAPLEGSLLVAPHGEGYVVYTGLSFFRQLPAGVPGAFRLFANLISLGK